MFREELHVTTTSKLLSSTHFKIKGNCSLKVLRFKNLKYTMENTVNIIMGEGGILGYLDKSMQS